MNNSKVSIVIPCYRGTKYLAEAITSCLNQTHAYLEVIVVDDCSPDEDFEIAQDFSARDSRVRVVRRERNGGIGQALNSGYSVATGDFFTRLAQDDIFRSDAIELLLNCLLARPEAGLAYSDMQLIDAAGKFLQLMPAEQPDRALFPANRVGLCVMWPRSVWNAVGPFDSNFDLCDDYEFFLRISRKFPFAKVQNEAPFYFRFHEGQGSILKERQHDIVRCRVHISHYQELLKNQNFNIRLWKKILTALFRLLACKMGIYQYWKYDGRSLISGRRKL